VKKPAMAYAIPSESAHHLGGITITKLIREHLPLTTEPDGRFATIGQVLDESIADRLREGETIQDVAFHFDTESEAAMSLLHRMYGLGSKFAD
jgi:hypothetical protein